MYLSSSRSVYVFLVILVACNIIIGAAWYRSYRVTVSGADTYVHLCQHDDDVDDFIPRYRTNNYTSPAPCANSSECKCETPEECDKPVECPPPTPPPSCNGSAIHAADTPEYAVDLLIVHFIPNDASKRRVVKQQPGPNVKMHLFTIYQSNDSICYSHPVNNTVVCLPRLHPTRKANELAGAQRLGTLQVSFDYLLSFRLYSPATTFAMLMEDDCSFCEVALNQGRVFAALQFMVKNNAKHMVVGPGACGQTFWSKDIKSEIVPHLEHHLVTVPRDFGTLRIASADELMKFWADNTRAAYMTKYNMIRHHDGKSMTWTDEYTEQRDKRLPHCGEIQSFAPPRFDVENCWNVMYSPCHTFNHTEYLEDVGYNHYRYDSRSPGHYLGSMVSTRSVMELGRASPYDDIDLGSNSQHSTLAAHLPHGVVMVLGASARDCNVACSTVGKKCDVSVLDSMVVNDCSFLNSVFHFKPEIKCGIPMDCCGPFVQEGTMYLGAFSVSRHNRMECSRTNPHSVVRFVCSCT